MTKMGHVIDTSDSDVTTGGMTNEITQSLFAIRNETIKWKWRCTFAYSLQWL